MTRISIRGELVGGKLQIVGGFYTDEEAEALARQILDVVDRRDRARFLARCSGKVPRLGAA